MIETPVETLHIHDRVRLNNGSVLIITAVSHNRPANPYIGVKEHGGGAEYKFGYKHRPVKIGTVDKDHPALRARDARLHACLGTTAVPEGGFLHKQEGAMDVVRQLVVAVEKSDHTQAALLAKLIRAAGVV